MIKRIKNILFKFLQTGFYCHLFVFISYPLFCQEKYEREERISNNNVPVPALNFINSITENTKIKWFAEYGLTAKSIEAKFKKNGDRYSIEFDTLGTTIQDIEKQIKWEDLPIETQENIRNSLKSICDKFKFSKIQIQYSGKKEDLILLMNGNQLYDGIIIRYEIIASCKKDNKKNQFEYLFDKNGALIKSSKIVSSPVSHLVY